MEEQPSVRAPQQRYHHGGERSPSRPRKTLKNEPSHCQHHHHQETQAKKTGNGKINGSAAEREKILSASDSAELLAPGNGSRQLVDPPPRPRQAARAADTLAKVGSKAGPGHKTSMDSRSDRPADRKEPAALLNGVVALSSGCVANGYPGGGGRPAADNDGSGSESGYTTPKKRKARRNSVKEPQEPEPGHPDRSGARPDAPPSRAKPGAAGPAAVAVPAGPAGELQRKNSDSKAAGCPGKKFEDKPGKVKLASSVAPREDSWTLFKPPPVFPVDNSSAKIVPKISYASKVKENLNKESQAPPPPARLSHVPMSAVKTVASAAFTNGPVSAEAACCSPAGALLATASPETPGPAVPAGENVASSPDSDSSSSSSAAAASGEPRKPGLFVYPLTPAHMQAALPSARPVDLPAAPTQQKALGDIFQNQWGLSFINEPSAGPEGAPGRPAVGGGAAEVTFQGQCAARGADAPGLDRPTFPKASDLDKRTSPHSLASVFKTCPPAPAAEGGAPLQPLVPDPQKGEAGSPGAIEFASAKDLGAESPQASPANPVLTAAKEQGQTKACDRRCSWGSFDLKAAVIYHTKEMEYILTLQKQDPKRVVVYDESKDRPDQ